MKFIIEILFSIWAASSLFMVGFWLVSFIVTYRMTGKILFIHPLIFILSHFCPIINTVKCLQIMRRTVELQDEKREM